MVLWLVASIVVVMTGASAAGAAPADDELLLRLKSAAARLQQGDAAGAIRDCKTALASDPRSAPAHLLLGQAYLALRSVERAADAKAELQQALDLDPRLVWARFYLAKIYLDLGRYARAKEELEAGLRDQPDTPHLLSLLGEADRKLGDPQASIELNRRALELDARMSPAHYYEALAYLDLKQEDAAMRELEAAIESPYVVPEMCTALASIYAKRQRLGEAEALCRKAIRLDPSRAESHLNLARIYNDERASDKALAELRLALPDGKVLPAAAYYQQLQADVAGEQGRAYRTKGMLSQAMTAYLRCVDLDPSNGLAHQQLAEMCLQRGDRTSAQDHAAAAEKLGILIDPAIRRRIWPSQ